MFEIAEKFPEELYLVLSPTQFLGIQSKHELVVREFFERDNYTENSMGDYLYQKWISECIDKSETINAIKRAFTLGKPQAINEVEEKILDLRQVIEKYMNDIENQLIWEHLQYHRRELESFRTSLDSWKPS